MKFFVQGDAARLPFADSSMDLVLGSPPYSDARSYSIGAQRNVDEWVEWMLKVSEEAVRVSKGLVLWVCAGVTRQHNYWPGPEGLMWEWYKLGNRQWRCAFWHRVGIPGSGGKQWLRADVEYVLCFTKCEKYIPFAENTANGHKPKWAPGGEMSYRNEEGERKNGWHDQFAGGNGARGQGRNAKGEKCVKPRLLDGNDDEPVRTLKKPKVRLGRGMANGIPGSTKGSCIGRRVPSGKKNGDVVEEDAYLPPVLANPGNLIKGIKVGGGLMGHKLAHENEAPYPQKLAEWFIRSHCEPGGIVLDPFSGSGTTVAAAMTLGRQGIGLDLRLNQCELGRRRCEEIQPVLF